MRGQRIRTRTDGRLATAKKKRSGKRPYAEPAAGNRFRALPGRDQAAHQLGCGGPTRIAGFAACEPGRQHRAAIAE